MGGDEVVENKDTMELLAKIYYDYILEWYSETGTKPPEYWTGMDYDLKAVAHSKEMMLEEHGVYRMGYDWYIKDKDKLFITRMSHE